MHSIFNLLKCLDTYTMAPKAKEVIGGMIQQKSTVTKSSQYLTLIDVHHHQGFNCDTLP